MSNMKSKKKQNETVVIVVAGYGDNCGSCTAGGLTENEWETLRIWTGRLVNFWK